MIRKSAAILIGISVWISLSNVSAQIAPNNTPENTSANNQTVLSPAAVPNTAPIPHAAPQPQIQKTPLDAVIQFSNGIRTIKLPGNWPLTVLDDFYNFILQKKQEDAVPQYILRNVTAIGRIAGNQTAGNHVETEVQIEFITTGNQPVQIPLGFKEGILPCTDQPQNQPLRYTGAGSAYLSVDPEEKQYLAVIIPQPKQSEEPDETEPNKQPEEPAEPAKITQRHSLSFTIWLPLLKTGNDTANEDAAEETETLTQNKLALSFPPTLRSQFQLEIPEGDLEADVTQGSILMLQQNAADTGLPVTLLTVQGLHTNTEISWQKKKAEVVNDRPVFLIENAAIDVRLDTQQTIYDAVLPISSTTGNFEMLQIKLPQGSILDRDMTDRYALAGGYSVGETNENSEVTVRFHQKMTGPVSLRLRAFQQFEGNDPDFERELAGFEVLGAERQTGFLSVSGFPAEKKLYWEQVRGIHRFENAAPNPATPDAAPIAASAGNTRFEFTSQPFSLKVRIISQQTHINVKPEYQFRISRGSVEMTARLSYTVSGSKADAVKIFLSDIQWNCECLSSIVDTAGVELDEYGELNIPLRSPMDGTFDIEVKALRALPLDEGQTHRIFLQMPTPRAEWCEPAPITIIAANDVEIEPIDELYSASSRQRTTGMTRQTRRLMPVRQEFPDLQQEPLFYRTEPTGAVFVADLTYRQREIHAAVQTDVRLMENHNQISQTFFYDADYAPVDRLYFLIPDTVLAGGDIQVRSGTQTLELRDTAITEQENVPANWKRKMIQLSEPKFQLPLTFEYSSAPFSTPADVTALYSLYFIVPADVSQTEHRIHFFAPSDYNITLQDESKPIWETYRETLRPSLNASGTFRSVRPPNKIALSISVSEKSISDIVIVDRAWLQTWLTGEIRVDRATYLLKNAGESVTVQLPPDAVLEHRIGVQIDHQPIQPDISLRGELTLPFSPEQRNRAVEVSIEYRYPFQIPGIEVPIVLPTFAKDTLIQYEYWQVFLQSNKHIVACSGGWTLEYDWSWNGLFWGRIPSLQKSDIGFTADNEAVDSKSQYLFSHLQPSGFVTLYIVNRSMIILCSSGTALFIGLILIYVRQTRYAGSLFGLGVILAAVLVYQPPIVLLMLQASVFGVFLVLGAGYIYRIFQRQERWIPPVLPPYEEHSQYHSSIMQTPIVHEVILDEDSTGDETPPIVNNPLGPT